MNVRGIGRWAAERAILRGLYRPEVFPADDAGVRRFIAQHCRIGEKITSADARAFAERRGVGKGFAAYCFEVADLPGLTPDIFRPCCQIKIGERGYSHQ